MWHCCTIYDAQNYTCNLNLNIAASAGAKGQRQGEGGAPAVAAETRHCQKLVQVVLRVRNARIRVVEAFGHAQRHAHITERTENRRVQILGRRQGREVRRTLQHAAKHRLAAMRLVKTMRVLRCKMQTKLNRTQEMCLVLAHPNRHWMTHVRALVHLGRAMRWCVVVIHI